MISYLSITEQILSKVSEHSWLVGSVTTSCVSELIIYFKLLESKLAAPYFCKMSKFQPCRHLSFNCSSFALQSWCLGRWKFSTAESKEKKRKGDIPLILKNFLKGKLFLYYFCERWKHFWHTHSDNCLKFIFHWKGKRNQHITAIQTLSWPA